MNQKKADSILFKILSANNLRDKIRTMTLEEFYNLYLKYLSEIFSESYFKQNLSTYKHLEPYKEKLLRHIDQDLAEKIIQEIKKSSPKSINVHIRNLKTAFNKAIDWFNLTQNPFEKIKRRGATKHQVNINHDDFNQLFTSMFKDDAIRCIASFAYYSGCRISEVISLKWEDIDLKNQTVKIEGRKETTKNELKRSTIPITTAMELSIGPFWKNRNKYKYVFCKKNGFPYTSDYVAKKFKQACRKLNFNEKINFDTLRSSFVGKESL